MGASLPQVASSMFEATEYMTRGRRALEGLRYDEAELAYSQALERVPDSIEAVRGLAYAWFQLGRLVDALDALERALQVDPTDLLSRLLMGRLCLRLQQPKVAEANFREILQRIPNSEAARSGLIDALVAQDGIVEAVRLCADILSDNPDSEVGHQAAARLAIFEGQDDRALSHFDKLLRLRPGSPVHRYNRALGLLRLGRFEEGWRDYEQRFAAGAVHLRVPASPRWNGAPVRRLLILAEQGLGDAILFARFLFDASRRCDQLLFACPDSLAGLIGRSTGVQCVPGNPAHWPEHDAHLPLMSLPCVLGVGNTTEPRGAYLSPDPSRRAKWSAALGEPGRPIVRIGIVHATSAAHATEEIPFTRRSCRAADLLPIVQTLGVEAYNLNLGKAADEARRELPGLRDLPLAIEDFDDTASLVHLLDAVVSVDTACAHVAGALETPLFLLLPAAADWKWQPHAPHAPWYVAVQRFSRTHDSGSIGAIQAAMANRVTAAARGSGG